MQPEDNSLLHDLFAQVRHLSLSVVLDDSPVVGLLPFVLTDDCSALLIHASNLARHSQGLGESASYSVLIHAADTPDIDPLQLPRVTISGHSARLNRSSDMYVKGRSQYVTRFPGSDLTFQLGDFHLHRLTIEKLRFVAGFGRAFNLTPDRLKEIMQA